MPRNIDFYGPYLKTERANQHISELEAVFGRYIDANKQALSGKTDDSGGEVAPLGGEFPKHTPTILGDAIHNLRAALDHAYCILVEAAGGTVNKHTKFPFTEKGSRQDLEGSAYGHAKTAGGPSNEMIRYIFSEIQPFPGGNGDDLIKLHVLDIADKHMVLLPTQQQTHVENIRLTGGASIQGITIVTQNAPAIVFGSGVRLEKEHDNKASFEICFGNGQPFEGQPILPILKSLSGRVQRTLELLERRAIVTSL